MLTPTYSSGRHTLLILVLFAGIFNSADIYAARITILFTGLTLSQGETRGLDRLNSTLQDTFVGDSGLPFSSRVFEWTEQDEALDFIDSHGMICCLALIGHSLGGNTAIQLAEELDPGIVDLLVQIDSFGFNDDRLPGNVGTGINYFQISEGFLEPEGETFVEGASNINVEDLFDDPSISHTSIDDDPRLHALIVNNIHSAWIPIPPAFVLVISGFVGLVLIGKWQARIGYRDAS